MEHLPPDPGKGLLEAQGAADQEAESTSRISATSARMN